LIFRSVTAAFISCIGKQKLMVSFTIVIDRFVCFKGHHLFYQQNW